MNKTESRVELLWSLQKSNCLDERQKNLLYQRLHSRITDEGMLSMGCEKHRSQHQNREEVTERFLSLILANLVAPKKRRPTKPSRSSIEKRIGNKKIRGELKRSRRKPPELS